MNDCFTRLVGVFWAPAAAFLILLGTRPVVYNSAPRLVSLFFIQRKVTFRVGREDGNETRTRTTRLLIDACVHIKILIQKVVKFISNPAYGSARWATHAAAWAILLDYPARASPLRSRSTDPQRREYRALEQRFPLPIL